MSRFIDPILLIFKGVLVGFGAILPGVSGGALCAAFGMYNPIINLLSHPFKALKTDGRAVVLLCAGRSDRLRRALRPRQLADGA